MPSTSNSIKQSVLGHLAPGVGCVPVGRDKVQVAGRVVHVRFCRADTAGSSRYKFGINPTSLSSDSDLWICGSEHTYYLVPVALLRRMYDHPKAYVDSHHPNIRVVTVDVRRDIVSYARGGLSEKLTSFRNLVFAVPEAAATPQSHSSLAPTPSEPNENYFEGQRHHMNAIRYERSQEARAACIRHYGYACVVCGFSFGGTYGAELEGFITVHHLRPIATVAAGYQVDPITDLRPVCANCHAVIHGREPHREIDEVKQMLRVAGAASA